MAVTFIAAAVVMLPVRDEPRAALVPEPVESI
jgi:hypothetical protein